MTGASSGTEQPLHAILVSVGSDGDVFPFIGLALRLHARGHRVTLVTNEGYRQRALEHHLDFRALFSKEESDELFANPDLWHPVRSGLVGARWGCRRISRHYQVLAELANHANSIFVANPTVFAARLVQEKLSKRVVSVVIGPWFIPSASAPPVLSGLLNLSPRVPQTIRRLYWDLLHTVGDRIVSRPLNQARARLGLTPVRRIFKWWFSPELVIGLFPEWYAPPQADWPARTRLAGFSMFDGGTEDRLPSALQEFCRRDSPVVALTFGTEMWHAATVFRAALEACQRLGLRALCLTRHSDQLPKPIPAFARHCEFAPFRHLFPCCAAVVHHGGIGTTAKALAAGTPQLILPFAFDQVDNATRVKRLGAGDWLKRKERSGTQIANALAGLITPKKEARCKEVAARFSNHDALDTAARWVEEFSRNPQARELAT